jgi:coenzyme F420-reducing hydrogenase gamma subunit
MDAAMEWLRANGCPPEGDDDAMAVDAAFDDSEHTSDDDDLLLMMTATDGEKTSPMRVKNKYIHR